MKLRILILLGLLFTIGCETPPLRESKIKNKFTQGTYPSYLDILLVIDSTKSFTSHRKVLRDNMKVLIEELQQENSAFRIGVTSGSAQTRPGLRRDILASTYGYPGGYPGLGLDGTFTTSGTNQTFITEDNNPTEMFIQSIDKLNLLSHLYIQNNFAFFNSFSWEEDDFINYHGGSDFHDLTFSALPDQTYHFHQTFTDPADPILGMSERFFDAIKMANQINVDIFPAHTEFQTSKIPLAIIIVKDDTDDQSVLSIGEAKALITSLRKTSATNSNVRLFSLVQNVGGKVATVTQELNDEDNGISGEVFNLTTSPSTVATALNAVKSSLQEPRTRFCLTSRTQTFVVTVDGVPQELDVDYSFDGDANCIDFIHVPDEGSEIVIDY